MAPHIELLTALLSSADRRFLEDPPRLLDFVPGTAPDYPLLLPTLQNATVQQYLRDLLSLSQLASEPCVNDPIRTMSRKAHLINNIHLRLNNVGRFIRFCYQRQL
jgi:hypothetical protein